MLNKILIKTKKAVFSERIGNNLSKFDGEGYDFSELRDYNGEDIRKIDWKSSAKLSKPYVKIFKEERELNIACISILSSSLHFGTQMLKKDLLVQIATFIGFNALKNRDIFSSYIYSSTLESFNKPSKREFCVHKMAKDIDDFDVLGKDYDIKRVVEDINLRVKKKSILVVIGDFWQIPNFTPLSKKHQLYAIIIRDKIEEDITSLKNSELIDTLNLSSLNINLSKKDIKNYANEVSSHDLNMLKSFRGLGVKSTKIYDEKELFSKLKRLFENDR